jgi:hypothetical protein
MANLADLIEFSKLDKLLELYVLEDNPVRKEEIRNALIEGAKTASVKWRMPHFERLFRSGEQIPSEILRDIEPHIVSCVRSCGQSEFVDDLANLLECNTIPVSIRKAVIKELPNAINYCADHGHCYRLSYLFDIDSVQDMKDHISKAIIKAMRVKLRKNDTKNLKYFIEHMPDYYPQDVIDEGREILQKINKA